jgi:hypothetical protein
MTGEQLFTVKTKRDYSGSEIDNYAQTLMTIYSNIGGLIFPLLLQAEKENKKLDVKTFGDYLVDEITQADVILV